MKRTPNSSLILLSFIQLGIYASYHFLPLLDPPNTGNHLISYYILLSIYGIAAYLARNISDNRNIWLIAISGLVFRAILLPLEPSMSDDLYRYLWDGRVQLAGYNPYFYPADSGELSHLRDWWIFPLMNHPHTRTPYPPIAQKIFLISQVIDPNGYLGYKLLLLGAELLTVYLLINWCRQRMVPEGRILWYFWHPLPIFELSLDGHIDGFALPLIVSLIIAIRRGSLLLSAALWSCLILLKPFAIWLTPIFALALWGNWRRRAVFFITTGLIGLIIYAPYLTAGSKTFEQMLNYARYWYFNGALYYIFDSFLPQKLNRTLLLLSTVGVSIVAGLLRRTKLESRLLIPLGGYFLLSPTLYPWYLIWLIPWLLFSPNSYWLWWITSTIYTAHAVHLVYLNEGIWMPPLWSSVLQILPIPILIYLQTRNFWLKQLKILIDGVSKWKKSFAVPAVNRLRKFFSSHWSSAQAYLYNFNQTLKELNPRLSPLKKQKKVAPKSQKRAVKK